MANSLQNRPKTIWNETVNDRGECLGSNAQMLPICVLYILLILNACGMI